MKSFFARKISGLNKLYGILLLIALISTIPIVRFLPVSLQKYRLITVKEDTDVHSSEEWYCRDFNHDGFSERFKLKITTGKNFREPATVIYKHNDAILGQWTFREIWLSESAMFGDFDHDKHDELYVFTKNSDSLFVYGIDVTKAQQGEFFLFRQYITRVKKPNPYFEWDAHFIPGKMLDVDDDGYGDLVFGVMSGLSLQPRQIYAYSIHKNEVIAATPKMGAYIQRLEFIDIDKDAKQEIIASTQAYENFDTEIPYRDDKAWLCVFNKNLNFLFPPKPFVGDRPRLKSLPCTINGNPRIFAQLDIRGTKQEPSSLLLFDEKGIPFVKRI